MTYYTHVLWEKHGWKGLLLLWFFVELCIALGGWIMFLVASPAHPRMLPLLSAYSVLAVTGFSASVAWFRGHHSRLLIILMIVGGIPLLCLLPALLVDSPRNELIRELSLYIRDLVF